MQIYGFRYLILQGILPTRHRRSQKRIKEKLKKLHESDEFNYVELQRLQNEKLRNLLLHAWRNIPYYSYLLNKCGVVKKNMKIDMNRFHEIPLLDKVTIRNNFDNLKTKDLEDGEWYFNTSGGSTGEPVQLIQDANYMEWKMAVKSYFDEWTGFNVGCRKLKLWGSERDLFVGRENSKIRILKWLHNEIWINTFKMTPEKMRLYVNKINTFKPIQILAYVESIYELALFIEKEKMCVYSPKSIMTSAGSLFPFMREKIEKVFQAPVFNRYGSREVGDIACECDHKKGLHVSSLTHYIEILKPDGTSAELEENGEVVITTLNNYAMPLIRYRIGDIAAWSSETCSCGRSSPLLKQVKGRVSDTFVTQEGDQVHGEYFTHLFYFRKWVRRFQVVQEDFEFISVLIVPEMGEITQETVAKDLADIKEKIRLVMGEECIVDVRFVEDIRPMDSGKYRYTISKVRCKPVRAGMIGL